MHWSRSSCVNLLMYSQRDVAESREAVDGGRRWIHSVKESNFELRKILFSSGDRFFTLTSSYDYMFFIFGNISSSGQLVCLEL